MNEKKKITFGPFRLDTADERLWNGSTAVPLRPKAFAVLAYLSSRPGQLVTKDELLEMVWPETCITDTVLKVCIREIREALGDNPSKPLFIETAHRRGYRFIAEIRSFGAWGTPGPSPPTNSETHHSNEVIAVLPFTLLDPDGDRYLAFGLADALITRLANLKQILVRPTSAVLKYADDVRGPIAAGRELTASCVLNGNVQRSGDRIRLTVQLIDMRTEAPIWAEKFDANFTDIFTLEDSISEQVASALLLELSISEKRRLTKRHTKDTLAYDLYNKGRYFWTKRTSQGVKEAIGHFLEAIEIDPNYALAYTGLADCYSQLSWIGLVPPADVFPKARAAALKALELDPLLAEAHASLGWIRVLYDWDWIDAEREFKRAIDASSNYGFSNLWYAVQLMAMSRFDEAIDSVERALEIDPLSPLMSTLMGWPSFFKGFYDEAIAHYQKALKLSPNYLPARILLGAAYEQKGDFSMAISEFDRAVRDDNTPWVLAKLCCAYAGAGEKTRAKSILKDLESLSKHAYVVPYEIAQIYAVFRDEERTIHWLEQAFHDRSSWLIFLNIEPKFRLFHGNVRFDEILSRLGLSAPPNSDV